MTSPRKVLIVEDELISAHNLADNLTDLGYAITAIVKTGEAAIHAVEHNPPDLILMDIQLKGRTSGIEAAQLIQTHQIPVIYLTAFVDDATLQKAARTHPYGYLTKPAKLDDIKSALEMALARSREEGRLRRLNQEEKRLNDLKSNFLAMLAHDLRTPLSVMLASLEIVRQYGEQLGEAKKQKHFSQMKLAIRQMTQQLETAMTAEQIAQGAMTFQPQPIDAIAVLQATIDSFQVMLLPGQTLQFISDCEHCERSLDSVLLEHIVNNLLTNAIKYSPDGGLIQMKLTCQPWAIVLTLQDQGIGIPSGFLNKVFAPFERADNVGHTKGTGIGLYIVQKSVERHQGQITVTSQEGQGSCFVVTLPTVTDFRVDN